MICTCMPSIDSNTDWFKIFHRIASSFEIINFSLDRIFLIIHLISFDIITRIIVTIQFLLSIFLDHIINNANSVSILFWWSLFFCKHLLCCALYVYVLFFALIIRYEKRAHSSFRRSSNINIMISYSTIIGKNNSSLVY